MKCFKHRTRKAVADWRICSDGPWKGVCRECDIELNAMGLKWAFQRAWRKKLNAYVKRQYP